jgi:hypothetical protein
MIDAYRIDERSEEVPQACDHRLLGTGRGMQGHQLYQVSSQGIEQVSILLQASLL